MVAVTSFSEASERAFELYDEIRQAQKKYDETYGGLSNPDRYWKYTERTEELERLKAEYQMVLDYMMEHYKEMSVDPLFRFQGRLNTGNIYHQQAQEAEDEIALLALHLNNLLKQKGERTDSEL